MITANFKSYASYITDSLHQWDLNQVLQVSGLNLTTAPEVHFSNANTDRAIVRQASLTNHVVSVGVPNSLLQDPLRIYAHIGIYEGSTFKVVELVEIPVIPRKRPADYQIQDADEEIYSFKALEAKLNNKADATTVNARIDNIITNANKTDGNSELVDIRVDANGQTRPSAGAAVREQVGMVRDDQRAFDHDGSLTFASFATWKVGGMTSGAWVHQINRIMSDNIIHFDRAITLKTADGFWFGVHTVTADGAFISDSGWQQGTYTVPAGAYFKLVIRRAAENNDHPNIAEFSGAVTFNSRTEDRLDDLQRAIDTGASKTRKTWLTSAHRGLVDANLKENSLAAFYNAYLNGADMIEVDARLSSDGVLVVNHDATVAGYTIANTPASTLCSLVLSKDEKWGTQYVPTLAQVLRLCYHTGLQVNIDLKDGAASAEAVAKMVLAHGMQGKVVYALNGYGLTGINLIMAIDPDARFIDSAANLATAANFAERSKRCYAYTSDPNAAQAIRASGFMVALTGLNASNFETAIAFHPNMCEYLHTSDFKQIEADYFDGLKLY